MKTLGAAISALLMLTVACSGGDAPPADSPTADDSSTVVQIANPASVYCDSLGGRVEIVSDSTGAQSGLCHLADGTVIEEWALYRRDHPRQDSTSAEG